MYFLDNRGFMTQRGLPDTSRSARYVIKDYLAGDLLYCHAPPGVDQTDYHQFPPPKKIIDDERRVS
jgi:large subunit GTPase 1